MAKLTTRGLLAAAGGLVVLGGVLAGGLVRGDDRPAPVTDALGRPAIVARPAPSVLPEPVAAGGACGAAMDTIRALQRTFPSGSMLTESADEQLNTDLTHLDQACASSPQLASLFRDRELTPWLTYLPPASAAPPDPTMTLAADPSR